MYSFRFQEITNYNSTLYKPVNKNNERVKIGQLKLIFTQFVSFLMKGVLSLKSNYKVVGDSEQLLNKFEEMIMMYWERIGNGFMLDEII